MSRRRGGEALFDFRKMVRRRSKFVTKVSMTLRFLDTGWPSSSVLEPVYESGWNVSRGQVG